MSSPVTALKQAVGKLVRIEIESHVARMHGISAVSEMNEINRKLAVARKRYREALGRVESAIRSANLP
jgi:hypothetical protein